MHYHGNPNMDFYYVSLPISWLFYAQGCVVNIKLSYMRINYLNNQAFLIFRIIFLSGDVYFTCLNYVILKQDNINVTDKNITGW